MRLGVTAKYNTIYTYIFNHNVHYTTQVTTVLYCSKKPVMNNKTSMVIFLLYTSTSLHIVIHQPIDRTITFHSDIGVCFNEL